MEGIFINKSKFLKELSNCLEEKNIGYNEKKEILSEFEEHILLSIKEGKSEQEAIEILGDPYEISIQYEVIKKIENTIKKPNFIDFIRFICKAFAKGIFGMCALFFILIGEFFIMIMTFIGTMLGVTGVICLFALIVPYIRENWILIGIEASVSLKKVILFFLGIVLILVGYIITKLLCSWNKKYYRSVGKYAKNYYSGLIKNKYKNKL